MRKLASASVSLAMAVVEDADISVLLFNNGMYGKQPILEYYPDPCLATLEGQVLPVGDVKPSTFHSISCTSVNKVEIARRMLHSRLKATIVIDAPAIGLGLQNSGSLRQVRTEPPPLHTHPSELHSHWSLLPLGPVSVAAFHGGERRVLHGLGDGPGASGRGDLRHVLLG